MAVKLNVFTGSDGFHAFTVAASSRPKALMSKRKTARTAAG